MDGKRGRLEIKIQPRPDPLPAAIKAKISNNYRRGISYRLPLSEGFSLSEEGRMESGGGGGKKKTEKERRKTKSHRSRHGKAWGRNAKGW